MRIGEAADRSGVSAKMIRYYESVGLIPPAARSKSGYRTYGAKDVHTLRFIRRARDLGFMVEDITELLSLWRDRSRRSSDVKSLALDHVARLRNKISEIEAMVDTLTELAESCHGDDHTECPILEDLEAARPASLSSSSTRFGVHGPRARGRARSVEGGARRPTATQRGRSK